MKEMKMELDPSLTQKLAIVREFIEANKNLFVRHGTVIQDWRWHEGKKLGPYYILRFSVDKKPQSIYLGKSQELAEAVRQLLQKLRYHRKFWKTFDQLKREIRKGAIEARRAMREQVTSHGLDLKGHEIRGWTKGKHGTAEESESGD
jgi:hypothetical protein